MNRLLCVALLLTCGVSSVCLADRPYTTFNIREDMLRKQVASIEGQSVEALRVRFDAEREELRMYVRSVDVGIRGAIGLWERTGEASYRDLALRAVRVTLEEVADLGDDALRAMITDRGVIDRSNIAARDACYHLALLHWLADDREAARKSAVLLARFAEAIPQWPVWNMYYEDWSVRKPMDPRDPKTFESQYTAGLWGWWIYFDLIAATPLMYAYDLVHPTGMLQDMNAVEPINEMFALHLQCQRLYNTMPEFSNMDAAQIRGFFTYGKLLEQPELCHEAVWWIGAIFKSSFYADGWWHEGSPSYHKDLIYGLEEVARVAMDGYSDPPGFVSERDGTRYDDLQVEQMLSRPFERAWAAVNGVVLPDHLVQVIGDTAYPQRASWTIAPTEAKPNLAGAMGHATLGSGAGKNMAFAAMHFGGSHGHTHFDQLAMIYYAKDRELISETQYHPPGGSDSTRDWHTITAGHATVVVNEQDQKHWGDNGSYIRELQPSDAIGGIPDWRWRRRGHGNNMNDGKLRLFNTDFEQVQVMEADAERAYDALFPMAVYRRTLALVRIGESDSYLVDIFRVKGGQRHDYMLHGCLAYEHTAELSVSLDQPMDGSLYKYITNLRAATTGDTWSATFRLADGSANMKAFVLGRPDTRIIMGEAPAMRRVGHAPFIAVRRDGDESIFVAVYNAFTGEPLVLDAELVNATMSRVELRVMMDDAIDTMVSTGDGFTHERLGQWSYEVGGKHAHRGTITATRRVEAGDAYDVFVTLTDLPTDGSLDGRTLTVDCGDLLVQSFVIDRVERDGNQTIIHSRDEPGMTIKRGLVKLEYYPGWGIAGRATFRIAGSQLTRQ
jgi:hypothetical protein